VTAAPIDAVERRLFVRGDTQSKGGYLAAPAMSICPNADSWVDRLVVDLGNYDSSIEFGSPHPDTPLAEVIAGPSDPVFLQAAAEN